jgi:Ca-activated chloride channel family protein
VIASAENIRRALEYLHSLKPEGGTQMLEAVREALAIPVDSQRLRIVCLLTDGYLSDEAAILREVYYRAGAARVFSIGVGSAPNRFLLDGIARLGRGAAAYLEPDDGASHMMEKFFERISHPAMTDLQLDSGMLYITEVFPRKIPDLFVGRPITVSGRFAGDLDTAIRINGLVAGQPVQLAIPAVADRAGAAYDSLPGLWARMKIAELGDCAAYDPDADLPKQIKQAALDYNLISPLTAFIAVDSTRQIGGPGGATVPVAVPKPAGTQYKQP